MRTYTVGVRCEGQTEQERRSNEFRANTIIDQLQKQVATKITIHAVDSALGLLREQPKLHGTTGAARLAEILQDRSNLGQVTCLELVNKAEGMRAQEQKLQIFLDVLEDYPEEAVCWFLFGRTPFLEKRLQYQLQIKYEYCRNLVLSGRRVLDRYLPAKDTLDASLPLPAKLELQQAVLSYNRMVQQHFTGQEVQGKPLTPAQCVFKKRLEEVVDRQEVVLLALQAMLIEWNNPHEDTPASRWKLLKRTAREVQGLLCPEQLRLKNKIKYFSVLRGILVTAFLPYYNGGRTVLGFKVAGILTVEHVITKPFTKKILANKPWKLPLTLLMGAKYVVERPGNADVLTELGKTQGSFPLKIFEPRKNKQAVLAMVVLTPSIRQFLAAGAIIKMLTLISGPAPGYKLTVKIVMSGKLELFFSRKAIDKTSPLVLTNRSSTLEALGVDINRAGKDVMALSEPVEIPGIILTLSDRYWHLEAVIKQLSQAFTKAQKETNSHSSPAAHRRLLKLRGELTRVYARRRRLLQQLFHEATRYLITVFIQTGCPIGCFEELNLTIRGTKGALAKAISSMPDDKAFLERVMLVYEWFSGNTLTIVLVDPRWTSQSEHVDCPAIPKGKLRRSGKDWDEVTCTGCKKRESTQTNAAKVIKLRGLKYLKEHS